jgi:DNA polymerase-3 subunit chi
MTDIRFYHMEQATLDQALPMIVMKAWQSGENVMVRVPDKREASRLNDLLWSFRADSFIPHGMDGDKHADAQPVFVTVNDENMNEANILILTHGCAHPSVADFKMTCEMLDGRVDSQITDARARWKIYKDDGHDLTYWQQDENGKWGKKA